jgi:hypothetical protein
VQFADRCGAKPSLNDGRGLEDDVVVGPHSVGAGDLRERLDRRAMVRIVTVDGRVQRRGVYERFQSL